MGYTALYRKFRPDTFEDVKGQDHIVKTLKNQIRFAGHVAPEKRRLRRSWRRR